MAGGLRCGCAALAGLLLAAAAHAQEPALADWRVERFDRELALPESARVLIDDPYGDVRVRAGDPSRLSVHAVTQRHVRDPRQEILEVRAAEGVGTVRVSYLEDPSAAPPEWRRRRVDLAIEVPRDAALEVRTTAGVIEVKGHAGPLVAASTSGEVRLWRQGPATVRTGQGSILALFLDPARVGPSRLETTTGSIEVRFRPETRADVWLETQGELVTDYSLTVEPVGQLRKLARARLGEGGARVELVSGHGALRLVRLLPTAESAPDGD